MTPPAATPNPASAAPPHPNPTTPSTSPPAAVPPPLPEPTPAPSGNPAPQAATPPPLTPPEPPSPKPTENSRRKVFVIGGSVAAAVALSFGASKFLGGEKGDDGPAPAELAASPPPLSGQKLVRKDLNFSLVVPEPWEIKRDDTFNHSEALVLTKEERGRKYRLTVDANPLGDPGAAESALQAWRANFASYSEQRGSAVDLLESQSINDLRYSRARIGSYNYVDDHGQQAVCFGKAWWTATHRGTLYYFELEAEAVCAKGEPDTAVAEIARGFNILDGEQSVDPMTFALTDSYGKTTVNKNIDNGCQAELLGNLARWSIWPEGATVMTEPQFAQSKRSYRHEDGTYLVVAPFVAPAGALDATQLLKGARLFWFPGAEPTEITTPGGGDQPSAETSGEAKVAGVPVRYHMRSLVDGPRHVVAIALNAREGDRSQSLQSAARSVGLEPEFPAPSEDGWGSDGRDAGCFRGLLAALADDAEQSGDHAKAAEYVQSSIRYSTAIGSQIPACVRYLSLVAKDGDLTAAAEEFLQRSNLRDGGDRAELAGLAALAFELSGEQERAEGIASDSALFSMPSRCLGAVPDLAVELDAASQAFDLIGRGLARLQSGQHPAPDGSKVEVSPHTVTEFETLKAELAAVQSARHPDDKTSKIGKHLAAFAGSDPGGAYKVAAKLAAKGRTEAGLALADALDRAHPKSCEGTLVRAQLAIEAGTYETAENLFDRATALDPSNEFLPAAFDKLSAAWETELATELALATVGAPHIEVPQKIEQRLTGVAGAAAPEGAGAFYRWMTKVVDSRPGAPSSSLITARLEIVDSKSVEAFNTLRYALSSEHERYEMRKLVVTALNGKTLASGATGEAFLQDANLDMATDGKILNIPVPGLRPGCRVDYELLRWIPGTASGSRESRHHFGAGVPVLREAFVAIGGTGGDILIEGEIRPIKGKGYRAWIADNPPPAVAERWAPKERSETAVFLASGGGSWEQLGRQYWLSVEPKYAPSPSITKQAAELTRDARTPDEKLHAISDFVRGQVSYLAIEFGDRAIIPKSPERTLTERYGDCKDQSTLLCTLLRAAGFDAHPALIRANGDTRRRFPSMSQFDHMIVAVRDNGRSSGWKFIDPTQSSAPPEGKPPYGLGGKLSLVVHPSAGILTALPGGDTLPALTEVQRELRVEGSDAHVVETVLLSEYHSDAVAPYMAALDEDKKLQLASAMLFGEAPVGLHLDKTEILEPDGNRMRFRLHYTASGAVSPAGGKLAVRLPMQVEAQLLMPPEAGSERTSGVQAPAALAVASETVATGLAIVAADEQSGGTQFETWTRSADGSALAQRFELSTETFAKDELGAFRKAVGGSLAAAQSQFVFVPEGTAAAPTAVAGEHPKP